MKFVSLVEWAYVIHAVWNVVIRILYCIMAIMAPRVAFWPLFVLVFDLQALTANTLGSFFFSLYFAELDRPVKQLA